MRKADVYFLCKGILLKSSITIYVNTIHGQIKYKIKQVSNLQNRDVLNSFLSLKKELPFIAEKEKKFKELFLKEINKNFKARNPLTLISMEGIPLKEELDKKQMRSFIIGKINELILVVGFLHSAAIIPVGTIYKLQEEKNFNIDFYTEGITLEEYQKLLIERDIKSILERYMTEGIFLQRKDKTFRKVLEIYHKTLSMKADFDRIIFYWQILTVFAEKERDKKLVRKVKKFIKKYLKNKDKEIEKYSEIRSRVDHFDKRKEEDKQAIKEMRLLIESLILKYIEKHSKISDDMVTIQTSVEGKPISYLKYFQPDENKIL